MNRERKCRVCGCTEELGCSGGCYWVDFDLCSQCADESSLKWMGVWKELEADRREYSRSYQEKRL